ncbi:hypothetical protein Tco_0891295 [Tanacetum coccineum]|uniref:Uncharacterized protein n=1 Tax=Tanacetum coccineum TaxID=301880 RepID=A0ABQ5C5R1_9ASTR
MVASATSSLPRSSPRGGIKANVIRYRYKDKLSANGRGNLHLPQWNNEYLDTVSQYNLLFRIQDRVVREYVMEFLSSFTFRDHILDLDNVETMVFQLGLYTPEEIGNALLEPFRKLCFRNRRNNYNLSEYFINISTHNYYDTRHPPSYTSIRSPIRRSAHRLLTLTVASRHNAKFFTDQAKGYKKKSLFVGAHFIGRIAWSYGLMTLGSLRSVTLGPETLLFSVAKLVDLGIFRYNGLGYGELVNDIPDIGEDEGAADAGDDDEGGVRRHPNMSFTNRLRAMDERLGEMEIDISKLGSDVDDLTYVVSGMSEQYDQFYEELGQTRMEQERFQNRNADHLSQLLSYHHIGHARYDGSYYSYVPNIHDLGVQQGMNFMSSTSVSSTTPSHSPSPNPFGLFGDTDAGPSTSQNQGNDMNED